jgi:hypothetical protein
MKSVVSIRSIFSLCVTSLVAYSMGVATPAFAADVITGALGSQGTLYLDLGAVDEFRWVKPDTSVKRESVSDLKDSTGLYADACKLALGVDPLRNAPLVAITTTGGTPGFSKYRNWIGVREQSGCSCGQVAAGQSLSMALTGDLTGYAVNHTELMISARSSVVIRADVTYPGQAAKTFYFKSGLSATGTPGPNDTFCDTGVRERDDDDHRVSCSWKFDGLWDHAMFTTVGSGKWAIAGPSSHFDLVKPDGVLACPGGGDNTTIDAGVPGTSPLVSGVRNPNVDGSACTPIPYNLTSSCDATNPANGCKTVFQYDPLGQGSSMSFTFHTEWPLEPVPAPPPPGVAQVKPTLQFFVNGSPTGIELNFCPEIVINPDGTVTGVPNDQDTSVGAPGIQAGCLIKRQVNQVGNKIQLIEDAYVQGDYTTIRR